MWRQGEILPFSRESLELLFSNSIPAVNIECFATPEQCRRLVDAIRSTSLEYYEQVTPPIGRVGVTQFECRSAEKSRYFAEVNSAKAQYERMVKRGIDPVRRMCEELGRIGFLHAQVAKEPDFGAYFAGLVREINHSALLHADVAELDARGWHVGSINDQLTWNLYIEAPIAGGECIVYDRQWRSSDESARIPGSYGYRMDLVSGADKFSITPIVGNVVLFNCKNFHQVLPAESPRLSIGSFIGRTKFDELLLWS